MQTVKMADELAGMVHELAAISECRATIRDEHVRACQEWGNEEYKQGLLVALQMLAGLEAARAQAIQNELAEWTRRSRLAQRKARDPREHQAVVVR